jgi:hypothetical protein
MSLKSYEPRINGTPYQVQKINLGNDNKKLGESLRNFIQTAKKQMTVSNSFLIK